MSDLSIDAEDPATTGSTVLSTANKTATAGTAATPGPAKSTSNLVSQGSKKAEENRRKFSKVNKCRNMFCNFIHKIFQ